MVKSNIQQLEAKLDRILSLKPGNNYEEIRENLYNLQEIGLFDQPRSLELLIKLEQEGLDSFMSALKNDIFLALTGTVFKVNYSVNNENYYISEQVLQAIGGAVLRLYASKGLNKQSYINPAQKELNENLPTISPSLLKEICLFMGESILDKKVYNLNVNLCEDDGSKLPRTISNEALGLLEIIKEHETNNIEYALFALFKLKERNEIPEWILHNRILTLALKKAKLDTHKQDVMSNLVSKFGNPEEATDIGILGIINQLDKINQEIYLTKPLTNKEGYLPQIEVLHDYLKSIHERMRILDTTECGIDKYSKVITDICRTRGLLNRTIMPLKEIIDELIQFVQSNYELPAMLSKSCQDKKESLSYLKLSLERILNSPEISKKIVIKLKNANKIYQIDLPEFKELILKKKYPEELSQEFLKSQLIFELNKGYLFSSLA